MTSLFDLHRSVLDGATSTIETRVFWSAYPEMPSEKIYGEGAKAAGLAAFEARRNRLFALDGHPTDESPVGAEHSPYGLELGISYPSASVDALISASKAAQKDWTLASAETRVGICLEILARLNRQSFEMANAVMHTSGQAFPMAFQAGGPHAQDRALEAVAYAWVEMNRTPARAVWSKPQGSRPPLVLRKDYRIVPRGIGLVIGCQTFPTWNSYPAIFADLATGNSVIVKPHPGAILPLAVTVETARAVLEEQGFDPNLVLLAADEPGAEKTKDLARHPDVALIDYTGSKTFGDWIRANAAGALLFTEETGVNTVVIASTDDFRAMCGNIAFSISLYSGQMCTAPQTIFVPRDGIETNDGHKDFDAVADSIAKAVDGLLADGGRAAAVCGAIASPDTLARIEEARSLGRVVRDSAPLEGDGAMRSASPLIIATDTSAEATYGEERFGPISFIVAADSTADAIERAAGLARAKGAITAAIYATDEETLDLAADRFGAAGVNLSCNLLGDIFVNQSAAFSDYHVTGANPAGNASLADAAFVANRFRTVMVRRPQAA